MYVSKLLSQTGDQVLKDAAVAGSVIVKAVNDAVGTSPLADTATGREVAQVYAGLSPEAQATVDTTVEDFLVASATPVTVIQPTGSQTRDYRAGIALMMAITLTLQCVAYTSTVIWISLLTRTIPDVTDTFVPFLAQIAVVWNYNGLLTKENRDSLAAGLGALPGGALQTLATLFASRRNPQTPPPQS